MDLGGLVLPLHPHHHLGRRVPRRRQHLVNSDDSICCIVQAHVKTLMIEADEPLNFQARAEPEFLKFSLG